MGEWRLFDPADGTPEHTTAGWYEHRERAPHLEQPDHQQRLFRAAHFVRRAVDNGAESVVDLGAGDGGLLSLVNSTVTAWGFDISPAAVAGAQERGVKVRLLDVVEDFDKIPWADVVVCTEMLEHQVDPHGFLRRIRDKPHGPQWLVASSPWNENDHNAYAFHTWAWDLDGYRSLVEGAGWNVVRHDTAGPFQVILARREEE